MILVQQIANIETFLSRYQDLIDTTIIMPTEAKEYYKHQWSKDRIIDQQSNWIFLEAIDEGGYIQGIVIGSPVEGGVGTIIWVLVDNDSQHRGIGSKLFKEAKKCFINKGAHKIKLTVPEEKTVEFYRKQGMILEGLHRNHWWNQDFWSMGLNLKTIHFNEKVE